MRYTILTVLAVLLASSAQADHDCRIASIDIHAVRRGDTLILRALFLGVDGEALRPGLCPDMNGPTWGLERELASFQRSGFLVTMKDPTGEVMTVSVATVQRPDRSFYREKRIRF